MPERILLILLCHRSSISQALIAVYSLKTAYTMAYNSREKYDFDVKIEREHSRLLPRRDQRRDAGRHPMFARTRQYQETFNTLRVKKEHQQQQQQQIYDQNNNRTCKTCNEIVCSCSFCNFCMRTGHTEYECWNGRTNKWQDVDNFCCYCEEYYAGHREEACPLMLRHRQQGAIRKAKCYSCGEVGHCQRDCQPTVAETVVVVDENVVQGDVYSSGYEVKN